MLCSQTIRNTGDRNEGTSTSSEQDSSDADLVFPVCVEQLNVDSKPWTQTWGSQKNASGARFDSGRQENRTGMTHLTYKNLESNDRSTHDVSDLSMILIFCSLHKTAQNVLVSNSDSTIF